MSDEIKHECGLAYIRLRKPFSYFLQKHGAVTYGLNKLYLLMEKQHNRGQDGAGIAAEQLKAMSQAGALTSGLVSAALLDQFIQLQSEALAMGQKVGGAFNEIKVEFSKIGRAHV